MYLYIFEDGEVKKATTVSDNDKNCVDAGILDIIEIGGDDPKQYLGGEWHDIESADA